MEGINTRMQKIDQDSGYVSGAMEGQRKATEEIAHSVGKVAAGAQQVIASVKNMNSAADESQQVANMVLKSSKDLTSQADQMHEEVGSFITEIRNI